MANSAEAEWHRVGGHNCALDVGRRRVVAGARGGELRLLRLRASPRDFGGQAPPTLKLRWAGRTYAEATVGRPARMTRLTRSAIDPIGRGGLEWKIEITQGELTDAGRTAAGSVDVR